MNKEVELNGENYKDVAYNFLVKNNLIKARAENLSEKPKMNFAISELDELSGPAGKALRAIRKILSGRKINILKAQNPYEEILKNNARLGIISAELFFEINKGILPIKKKDIEAFAAIDYKMLHIFLPKNSEINSFSQIKKLGIAKNDESSIRIANIIIKSLKLEKIKIESKSFEELSNMLSNNKLDSILLMLPLKHTKIMSLMENDKFKLLSLKEWEAGNFSVRFPFLRSSRIPKNTYKGQQDIIETINSQIVLACIAKEKEILGDKGPASAIAKSQSLSDNTMLQIIDDIDTNEEIDPTIPKVSFLSSSGSLKNKEKINSPFEVTILNAFVLFAIGYLLYLFLKEDEKIKSKV